MRNLGGFEYRINIHTEMKNGQREYIATEIMGLIVRKLTTGPSPAAIRASLPRIQMRKPDFITVGPLSPLLQKCFEIDGGCHA